jgi:hypothetical protein
MPKSELETILNKAHTRTSLLDETLIQATMSTTGNSWEKSYASLLTSFQLKLIDYSDIESPIARWAKNNAFVFLIGLDGDANFMDNTKYGNVISTAKRDGFKWRAKMAFDIIDFEVKKR